MRILAALATGVLAVGALVGCSTAAEQEVETPEDTGAAEGAVIGYSVPLLSNPTIKAIDDALRAKAEEYGAEVVSTDAQFEVSKQFSDIQSLINRDVDVLIIWAIDPLSIMPAVEQAIEKGIPVITQETAEPGPYASNFLVSNFEGSKVAAEMIADEFGEGAAVGMVEGLPTIGELKARSDGFNAGVEEFGLDLIASQINEIDSADGARPIADAWKSRFGAELQAIYAYNDPSALGVASAVGGDFNPLIIGFNGSIEGVEAVRDGRIHATFDQHPVFMGAGLGWAAIELIEGRTLPETVLLDATPVTAETVDSWESPDDQLKKSWDVSIDESGDDAILVVTEAK